VSKRLCPDSKQSHSGYLPFLFLGLSSLCAAWRGISALSGREEGLTNNFAFFSYPCTQRSAKARIPIFDPFVSLPFLFYFYFIFYFYLECAGHSFAYVAHSIFLRDVWIRTPRAAVASRRATN
jgi:hypothetical protein